MMLYFYYFTYLNGVSEATVTISHTEYLSPQYKETILSLWNSEYPVQLGYRSMDELDAYFDNLADSKHYFAVINSSIVGWSFCFLRDQEIWFAIVVGSNYQGMKVGSELLNRLKADHEVLNGWVTDHEKYVKADGSQYQSPLTFYAKQGFEILHDTRLEIPKLSAVKIQWRRT